MTKTEFAGFIREHGPVILDGATGTNLMEAGMPIGVCPESWVLENPQVLLDLQRRYVEAGSHIVYASTFTGNRIKLEEYGLQERLEEINTQLVALSRQAVGDQALVAGDMTMTGQQLFPMGELLFEELVDVYKEQASVLAKAGVDLFVVETMMSLQECRAAVIAIREVCDLPIMVTLTYNEDGRTLFGTPPETAVVVLQSLGVDAIGVNCSTGPMEMVPLVEKMAEYAMGIEERDKRQRCAETIVRIMANFSAQNRNTPGLQQKLWDHLAFMTGYKLEVDYPFPIEQRIGSNKPEQVPYPTSKIHFRHYGHLMEVLLRELSEMPEGEKRDELMKLAAARMRRNLETWNKDSLNDEKIQNDIQRYMDEFK